MKVVAPTRRLRAPRGFAGLVIEVHPQVEWTNAELLMGSEIFGCHGETSDLQGDVMGAGG